MAPEVFLTHHLIVVGRSDCSIRKIVASAATGMRVTGPELETLTEKVIAARRSDARMAVMMLDGAHGASYATLAHCW
jgi:hypothetical protein